MEEKYHSGILKFDSKKELEVTTMHVPPGSSNGIEKIISIEQFYKNIIDSENQYRMVCGDWNTPRREYENGDMKTWMKTGGRIGEGEKEWDKRRGYVLRGSKKYWNSRFFSPSKWIWYKRI